MGCSLRLGSKMVDYYCTIVFFLSQTWNDLLIHSPCLCCASGYIWVSLLKVWVSMKAEGTEIFKQRHSLLFPSYKASSLSKLKKPWFTVRNMFYGLLLSILLYWQMVGGGMRGIWLSLIKREVFKCYFRLRLLEYLYVHAVSDIT